MSKIIKLFYLLLLMMIRPIRPFEFSEILDFFWYQYDKNCTYKNIKPDGLIETNVSKGLVFFRNKVWKTSGFTIVDPKYEYLESIYPQLNHYRNIDSIFTFLDEDKKIRYCFIIQANHYFIYLTQLANVTLDHHQFTNQAYIGRFKEISSLVPSINISFFMRPMYCASVFPVDNEYYFELVFFNYYTKFMHCFVNLEYQTINEQLPAVISNLQPIFRVIDTCKEFSQDLFKSDLECRFLSSVKSAGGTNNKNDTFQNSTVYQILLGQRKRIFYQTVQFNQINFTNLLMNFLLYKDIWNCDEISYKNYNTIKFRLMPMFIVFTISFIFLNRLFKSKEDKFAKQFAKEKFLNQTYKKIRTNYVEQQMNEFE